MSADSDHQNKSTELLPNENENIFVLHVWPGEWDLPSLDPECLTAMCYLKYTEVEHKIEVVNAAWNLFKNDYPRLEYKNKVYIGLEDIIQCIKKEKNIDLMLSDTSSADMLALLSLFKQKFLPAFNLLCWLDEDNTYTIIRRAYGKYLRFPLSIFKLKQIAMRIENSITSQYKSAYVQLDSLKQQILYDGKECLNILSVQLDESVFMFENRPSLIDAYLFGYLSVLNRAPFVNSPLKTHLIVCSNLNSLIFRIHRELFPVDKKDSWLLNSTVHAKKSKLRTSLVKYLGDNFLRRDLLIILHILTQTFSLTVFYMVISSRVGKKRIEKEAQKTKETNKNFINWFKFLLSKSSSSPSSSSTAASTSTKFNENEEWEKRRQQIIAVSIAVAAMFVYAFAIGFIKIDIIKTDLEYTEKH